MVKLFVGNLADTVDSHRLKNLFLQHVNVQECDVLKNFAFVVCFVYSTMYLLKHTDSKTF